MRSVTFVLMATLAASFQSPGLAMADADEEMPSNEGHWRVLLKDQLKATYSCDLNEVIAFQEVPLGADVGVDGRISCIDGREFEFTRKGKRQKFEIKICSPAVC